MMWRRGWDSNPRYGLSPYNGLANRRLQPLGHPSKPLRIKDLGALTTRNKPASPDPWHPDGTRGPRSFARLAGSYHGLPAAGKGIGDKTVAAGRCDPVAQPAVGLVAQRRSTYLGIHVQLSP